MRNETIPKYMVVLWFLLAGHLIASAQGKRHDEPISDELNAKVSSWLDKIEAENSTTDRNDWAGTYWNGDHHPTVFRWAPKSGFVVTSSLYTFSPSWVNFGKVDFDGNLLVISPELPKDEKSAHVMPTRFTPIAWDDWRFLVPSDQLLRFAYAVHSKSESQLWEFFVRPGDRDKDRKGLPRLPKEFTKYMTMPAKEARIINVEGDKEKPWSMVATIDAGSRQGIIEGMSMYHVRGNRQYMMLGIVKVGVKTSTAAVTLIGGSDENIYPKRGLKLSSRMPRGFIEPD